MNKEQIIELWKCIGWNTITDYHNYLKSVDSHIILDELDSDVIDSKIFWSAADEHFFTDPVCNHNNTEYEILDISQSNYKNYLIPLNLGMMGQMMHICAIVFKTFGYISIAEIGSGYNSFKTFPYLDINNKYYPKTGYTGFDIIKRNKETVEIQGKDGTFSDTQITHYKDGFNVFFSSNTFQHLSPSKIEKYLKQVYEMLPHEGYFNLMYVSEVEKTYHYGQIIHILNRKDLTKMVKDIGFNIVGSAEMHFDNSLSPYSLVLKK